MRTLTPTHVVFNGKVGALIGKNALPAKVGETVLIVHSQANRDSRPHLIGGHGDYVWETGKSGARFRLPTDAEWAYAAGSRFNDGASGVDITALDPGRQVLARYEQEVAGEPSDVDPLPTGRFGVNENGLADMAGNVWEWTDSCFVRATLDLDGRPSGENTVDCGVRVVEGRHRTFIPDLIRDARAGGCAVGAPPTNLGFRLLREDDGWAAWRRLIGWARRLFGAEQYFGLQGTVFEPRMTLRRQPPNPPRTADFA